MKRKKIGIIYMCCFLIFFSFSFVFASDDTNNKQQIDTDSKNETEEILKARQDEINKMINESLVELKANINNLDKKIDSLKGMEEYKTYPAIRLNVEIPFFGLSSIVDYRLKILTDVSTSDVLGGYSVKSIVKSSSIKVPSFSIGSIVVITRDIDLKAEDISLSDSTTALLKLMQYINQVKSVDEFLNNEINNVFTSYIPKDRADKALDLKKRIEQVNQGLVKIDKYTTYLHLLNKTNNENAQKINKTTKELYDLKIDLNDVLINESSINDVQKSIVIIENDSINLNESINNTFNENITNIDKVQILTNLKQQFINIKDEINKYLEESKTKVEIENNNGNPNNSLYESKENDKKGFIEDEIYITTSKETVEYMENVIKSIEEKIETINKQKANESNENSEGVQNKNDTQNVDSTKSENDINTEFLDELSKIYGDFISKQNKFYLDNLNLILNDTTSKISNLMKYTDKNVLQNMKYIFLELPNNINYYLKLNSLNTNSNLVNQTSQIKSELQKILSTNINVNKLHDEMLNDNINKTRENN